MASEAQIKFLHTLYAERQIEPPSAEELQGMSNEDASLEITVLLRDVESAPATPEQVEQMNALTAELGPRRDGREWEFPTETGKAAAFIVRLNQWVRGKQYAEKVAARKAVMASRGVTFREDVPAVEAEDNIPF